MFENGNKIKMNKTEQGKETDLINKVIKSTVEKQN